MSEGTSAPTRGPIECRRCDAVFIPNRRHHAFCSLTCQQLTRNERRCAEERAAPRPSKACEKCRESYQPTRRTQRFCSKRCGERSRIGSRRPAAQLAISVCPECTTSFFPYRSTQEFCAPACREKARARAAVLRKTAKMCRSCAEYRPRTTFPDGGLAWVCQDCVDLRGRGLKRCGACRATKPVGEFNRGSQRSALYSYCRDCCQAEQARRKQDPAAQRQARTGRLLRSFGITADQFDEILAAQGGGCGMCGDEPTDESFHVDHDHACCAGSQTCGQCIRSILCRHCNQALGFLRDSVDRAEAAVAYLRRHAPVPAPTVVSA